MWSVKLCWWVKCQTICWLNWQFTYCSECVTCYTIFFCILLKAGVVRRAQFVYRNTSRYFWQLVWTTTDHSFSFIIYLPQYLILPYFLGNTWNLEHCTELALNCFTSDKINYINNISLMKRQLVLTHTIRQTQIPTLLHSLVTNTPSVKMLYPQKEIFLIFS